MNGNGEKSPADLFKALSEDMRLRLLRVLEGTGFSVVELMEVLDAPQSTISRHLARLKEAGLIESRRQGAMVFYSRSRDESPFLRAILEASWGRLPQLEADREAAERVLWWRARLIHHLRHRPEGFSDGRQLLAGRPYPATLAKP